jgi:hypothetical protein
MIILCSMAIFNQLNDEINENKLKGTHKIVFK